VPHLKAVASKASAEPSDTTGGVGHRLPFVTGTQGLHER
jgi:hypothetical protein